MEYQFPPASHLIVLMDVHSKKKRSYNMSMIKGKNTLPELIVRKYLHSKGFRFRLHDKRLPGKPDIVLPKYKLVIQVHGCFWHKHNNCEYFVIPKTRRKWWMEKINKTVARDRDNVEKLKELGWNSIIIWECELKRKTKDNTLNNLLESILCQK